MTDRTIRDEQTLEHWLVARVARELQVDESEVDPHARITMLGIDSLALIGLAGELAEVVNRELRAEILWEHETIAALARHLTRAEDVHEVTASAGRSTVAGSADRAALNLLQAGAGGAPAIAVGSMNIAALLKDGLPSDVPVGWLKLDPLYRGPHHVQPVPQQAAAFAGELTDAFPDVPLTLVGYSYCGILAFDLACQLVDRSREVRLLLLEPARFDRGPLPESWSYRLRRHLRALRGRRFGEQHRYLGKKVQSFFDRMRVKLFRQRLVARKQSGASVPSRFNWMLAEPGLMASLRGYRPPVLESSAVIAARPAWIAEEAPMWARQIRQNLVTIPLVRVPDHHTVQLEQASRVWMQVIRDWHADVSNAPANTRPFASRPADAAVRECASQTIIETDNANTCNPAGSEIAHG